MRHRLLPLKNPTIGALAAGFLVLLWGLFSLQRVFQREQEDARQAVLARQT
ncbi:MAG: hypothetical protein GY856_55130, partial [bacterium]|nr:hypothetical protein [bacterium]